MSYLAERLLCLRASHALLMRHALLSPEDWATHAPAVGVLAFAVRDLAGELIGQGC